MGTQIIKEPPSIRQGLLFFTREIYKLSYETETMFLRKENVLCMI